MKKAIGSIVVFNPNISVLKKTIETFLKSPLSHKVYIWDNSSEDKISAFLKSEFAEKIVYIQSPANFGFGRGHNEVFRRIDENYDYFIILNPDLEIPDETIEQLTTYLENNPEKGLVTGIIKGVDGQVHQVHKYLPSFSAYISSLIKRFMKGDQSTTGESIDLIRQEPYSLPILSGCFMLFTKSHFQELKGFDDRFFLYFEDYDLTLRSYLMKKSVIVPSATIVHKWERGSSKNKRLFLIHIISGLKFYLKWGFTNRLSKKVNHQQLG